jgi:chromosome segregation ATPase
VTQGDYDDLKDKYDTSQTELTAKKAELTAKTAELTAALVSNETTSGQLAAKTAEIAAADGKLQAIATLLGVANTPEAIAAKITELAGTSTDFQAIATLLSVANTPAAITAGINSLISARDAAEDEKDARQIDLSAANGKLQAIATSLGAANTADAVTAKITELQGKAADLTTTTAALTAANKKLTDIRNLLEVADDALIADKITDLFGKVDDWTTAAADLSAANGKLQSIATLLGVANTSDAITARITALKDKETQLGAATADIQTIALLVGGTADDSAAAIKTKISAIISARTNAIAERDQLILDLAAANKNIAFMGRQLSVLQAGGRSHDTPEAWAAWFAKHDDTITALKTAKAENRTIDAILIGDHIFDEFDDPEKATYDFGTGPVDQYDDFLAYSGFTRANTINLGFSGDTIADMQWRFDEIVTLKDTNQLPVIKRVIVNAGGEDLARAGSTSTPTQKVGSGTAKIIGKRVNALITNVKTGLPNAKVGSLTTVYRSDVNFDDYGDLINEIYNNTTADAVYNSFAAFPNTYPGNFETDGVHLSTEGYMSLNFVMQYVIEVLSD